VVAGNAQNYTKEEWISDSWDIFLHRVRGDLNWEGEKTNHLVPNVHSDIILVKTAQAAHIDAFAINIGVDASNEVQLPMIYDSAKSLGFKVFICWVRSDIMKLFLNQVHPILMV
jgi:hypothetical protein